MTKPHHSSQRDKPNVVLLVMDTARAKSVLDAPEVLPNFHRIASEGTLFRNVMTTAPWTLPSHASLFTGQRTSDHGAHAASKVFEPTVPTLAERLNDHGYRTLAYSNNTWISEEFGFARGFDSFLVGWELAAGGADLAEVAKNNEGTVEQLRAVFDSLGSDAPQTLLNAFYARFLRQSYDSGAGLTNFRLKRRLRNVADSQPFFAFVNYLEPHLEYDPPRQYRYKFCPTELERSDLDDVNQDAWAYLTGHESMTAEDFTALEALYDAELHYLDHRIGTLYDFLDERNELDDTVFIVIGDHGENIGDHDMMDHQYSLYDTLTHVPLVVRYPEAFASGDVEHGLVELRDLYPTILDIAGITPPTDSTVSSMSLIQEGTSSREHVVAEYAAPQPSMDALEKRTGRLPPDVQRYDRGLRCLRNRRWKYIEGTDGTEELYNLRRDRNETTDVAADHPDTCEELRATLHAEHGEMIQPEYLNRDMDEATEQRLEDLGYLQ